MILPLALIYYLSTTEQITMYPPTRFQPNTEAFKDFWEFEDGREMLKKLKSVPDIAKANNSVHLLYEKDELADQVILDFFIGQSFPKALQAITDFASGKTPLESAPISIQILLNQMNSIPQWLDPHLISLGTDVSNRSGKSGLIVLRNYSLMLGYQSAAINKPLIATGALHSGAVKRIADTTNFWYAVTGKDALSPGNEGFLYCLRTRIVHSYSRIMIKEKLNWKLSEQGEPLNYWDMQATYIGFSLIYMQGLKKLGMLISDKEIESVYHLWKYIGYLIGIPTTILPDNDVQAIENLYLWSKTQPETDADSIELAKALHEEPLTAPWPPKPFQKRFIQHVNIAFNHFLIGQRSCDVLKLPAAAYPQIANVVLNANRLDNYFCQFDWYKKRQIKKGRSEQLVIRNRVNG